MKRRVTTLLLLALISTPALAAPATRPYDRLRAALDPYYAPADPLGWPMKARALTADRYTFWRGTKDLYYAWLKQNAADWFTDSSTFVPCHGDLHLGNLGTYVAAWDGTAAGRPTLGFGLVDFDDAAPMPVEADLLDGVVTMELIGESIHAPADPAARRELADALLGGAESALTSGKPAADLAASSDALKTVGAAALLDDADKPYAKELKKITDAGRFVQAIVKKNGEAKEFLDPVDDATRTALVKAVARAAEHSPSLAGLLNIRGESAVVAATRDVARRTRLGSSGSQGLEKYVVLIERPGGRGEVVIYLKREVPCAAERQGLIAADPAVSPGHRASMMQAALTAPPAAFNSWADVQTPAGPRSFWVSVREPWTGDLEAGAITTPAGLKSAASAWGESLGAAHATTSRGDAVLATVRRLRADPSLLLARAAACAAAIDANFDDFKTDPRVAADAATADAAVRARLGK